MIDVILISMSDKSDKNNIATKEDIKKLASRTELRTVERNLRTEILRVEAKVENVEERLKKVETKVDTVDVKLDRLQNTLDGFVGRIDDLTADNEVGAHHTRELQAQVRNHEKRIKKVESTHVT